jgi:Glycosyltransferase family 87
MPKEWVLALRSVMAVTLVSLSFLSSAAINMWSKRARPLQFSDSMIIVGFLAGRVIAIFIFHFVMKLPVQGDLVGVYIENALKIPRGELPYRDFVSPYGFLFSYLIYLLLEVWQSYRVVILFGLVMDAVLISFLLACTRICNVPQLQRLLIAVLVFLNPLQFSHVTILGSNQHWLTAVATVAFYLILRNRELLAGAMLGAAVAWIKLTIGLFVPPFLISAKRPVVFLAACGGTIIIYLAILWAFGINPFFPLVNQFLGYDEVMTNNIWFYLELFLPREAKLLLSKVFLATVMSAIAILIIGAIYRNQGGEQDARNYKTMLSLLVFVWSCFMAFSPKSNSWYFVAVIPFAYWWAVDVARHGIHYLITVFGGLASVNMSMHALLFTEESITQIIQRGTLIAWTFLTVDFSMLVIEIVLVVAAGLALTRDSRLASIFRSARPAPLQNEASH